MTETNQNQTEPPHSRTTEQGDQTQAESKSSVKGDPEPKKQTFLGIPMPLLLAIVGGLGTFLGAGLTSLGEVITSYWEFNAQFRQGRQEFEFELIREALEVQPISQATNEDEQTKENGNAGASISFAQNVVPEEEDTNASLVERDKEDRLRAAQELEFYADIGIIKSLDAAKVKEWAEDPDNLPRLQSSNDSRRCFYVDQPTNLYSRPDFDFPIDASYRVGDIAYASFPYESVSVQGGTNSFILVDLFGGNKAWVPRYPEASNIANLVDFPPQDCLRP